MVRERLFIWLFTIITIIIIAMSPLFLKFVISLLVVSYKCLKVLVSISNMSGNVSKCQQVSVTVSNFGTLVN